MNTDSIRHQLKDARKALNLNMDDLSQHLDMPKSSYGRLESGSSKISIEALIKISESLNVDLSYFVNDEDYISAVLKCKKREMESNPYAEIKPFIKERLKDQIKEKAKDMMSRKSLDEKHHDIRKDINILMEDITSEGLLCVQAYIHGWIDRNKKS